MSKKSKHSKNLVKLGNKQFVCKCLVPASKTRTTKKQAAQELKYYQKVNLVPLSEQPMAQSENDTNAQKGNENIQPTSEMIPCNKEFSCISNLIVHQRIHSGTKPFECPQCCKKFASSGNMQDHMNRHTNTKPYECNQCDQKFYRLNLLKTHQKKMHSSLQISEHLSSTATNSTSASSLQQQIQITEIQPDTSDNCDFQKTQLDLQQLELSNNSLLLSPSVSVSDSYARIQEKDINQGLNDTKMSQYISQEQKLPDFSQFEQVLERNHTLLQLIDWNKPDKVEHVAQEKELRHFLFPAVRRVIVPTFTKNLPPCKYY